MSAEPLRVVGLVGSLRVGSFTRSVVELALAGAAEVGAETALLDLNDFRLSFCGMAPDFPEDVHRLRELTRAAHGIVLGSPEYHGSYSGVLKNALDLMSFEEFEGKMLGLVGVGGGALGAAGALSHLRAVCRALHAWVVPTEASVPRPKSLFAAGVLTDAILAERVKAVGREVARYAWLHSAAPPREALRRWEAGEPPN